MTTTVATKVLDFSQDYVLEDSVVKLEPLTKAHLHELEESVDAAIWKYFLGRSDGSANFEGYIEDAIAQRKAKKEYPFAVFDKRVGKYVGSTRFFEYDAALNTIRLGYSWYGRESRGTGLNKHCKYLLFAFAFEELGVERVGLGAHEENKVSIAAMKSVGCQVEGRIRNLFPSIDGKGRSDAVLLGMIQSEWFDTAKSQLKQKL